MPKHRTAAATEKEPCSLSPEVLGASDCSLRVQVHGGLDLGDPDRGGPDMGRVRGADRGMDLGGPDMGPDLGAVPGMDLGGLDMGPDLGAGLGMDRGGLDMGLDLGAVMGMAALKTRNKTIALMSWTIS